jgi:hypothetical protein
MSGIAASGYPGNSARLQSDMMSFFEQILSDIKEMPGGTSEIVATNLSAHTFTPPNNGCTNIIDTAGFGSTDTLNTINASNLRDGQIVILRSVSSARVITINNANGRAGQILTADGNSIVLSATNLFVCLKYNATLLTPSFEELFRSTPASSGGGVSQPTYGGVKAASFAAVTNYWYDIDLASATADVIMTVPDPTISGNIGVIKTQFTTTSTTYGFQPQVATTSGSQTIDALTNGNFPKRADLRGRLDLRLINSTWRTELSC